MERLHTFLMRNLINKREYYEKMINNLGQKNKLDLKDDECITGSTDLII